jgi:glycosyltransferase involved in cell wall biosynthesis
VFTPLSDPLPVADCRDRLGLPSRILLSPGGADWRKNLPLLVDAWSRVPPVQRQEAGLVITGDLGVTHGMLDELVERLEVPAVHLVGRVTDEELRILYQMCEAVVFPSRFEGYGLPVMEARQMGCPVLAARASSVVELLPDAALFDPDDPQALAGELERVLRVPPHRESLARLPRPAGHTWPEVASRVVNALDTLPRQVRRSARPRRPRLAVVSPLPPQPTGVADHTLRLVESLASRADVHAFTHDLELVRLPDGVGLHRLDHIGRVAGAGTPFDAVVHCWGNSWHHAPMLPAIRTWPGIVLAHDVAVAGLYDRAADRAPDLVDHADLAQLLTRQYGDTLPDALRHRPDLTYRDADALGLPMAGEVIDAAEHYLVHSRAAAELARRDRPDSADRIHTVAFAFPPARPRRDPARVGRPPVIATFGLVSLAKAADTVVDTLGALGDRHSEAILVFVGEVGYGLRRDLAERARSTGIDKRVLFTGRVPREIYEHWLTVADVAVQLRRSWGGEASAATADAMAWGVPTVVSDIGWARELPRDAVVHVPGVAASADVADAVSRLLTDTELRSGTSACASAHAAAYGFDRLAAAILDLVHRG